MCNMLLFLPRINVASPLSCLYMCVDGILLYAVIVTDFLMRAKKEERKKY